MCSCTGIDAHALGLGETVSSISNEFTPPMHMRPQTPRYPAVPMFTRLPSLEKGASNNDVHDFVGALEDLVNTAVPEVTLDGVILQVAVATVQLQAVVDDVEALWRWTEEEARAAERAGELAPCSWRISLPWQRRRWRRVTGPAAARLQRAPWTETLANGRRCRR
jgi:hypothetical protein